MSSVLLLEIGGACKRRHWVAHGGQAEAADSHDDHMEAAAGRPVSFGVLCREPCPTVRFAPAVLQECASSVRPLNTGLSLCRTLTEDYTETVYDVDVARVRDVLVQLVGEVCTLIARSN